MQQTRVLGAGDGDMIKFVDWRDLHGYCQKQKSRLFYQ